jgi:hypothetical protein
MQTGELDDNFMFKVRPFLWHDLIRLGRAHDGGYVVPAEIVRKTRILISLGYGNDYSFEKDFLWFSPQSKVILIDENAGALFYLCDLVSSCLKRLTFNGGHPRAATRNLFMFLGLKRTRDIQVRRNRVASSRTTKSQVTLSSLLNEFDSSELVLKIDIEGSEYECLLETKKLANLSCLIVEFHNIPNEQDVFDEVLSKIQIDFILVNTHINNFGKIINGVPEAIELSFVNRRFVLSNLPLVNVIPSVLDQRNSVRFPEVHYTFK